VQALYEADAVAAQKAAEADLRPDADKVREIITEAAETAQTGAEKPKTRRKK
jgi:hypothetical protein